MDSPQLLRSFARWFVRSFRFPPVKITAHDPYSYFTTVISRQHQKWINDVAQILVGSSLRFVLYLLIFCSISIFFLHQNNIALALKMDQKHILLTMDVVQMLQKSRREGPHGFTPVRRPVADPNGSSPKLGLNWDCIHSYNFSDRAYSEFIQSYL